MIVCICKTVSDRHIRRAAGQGVVTLRELSRQLGVGTGCGKCVPQAREVLAACGPSADLTASPPARVQPAAMPLAPAAGWSRRACESHAKAV